MSILITFELQKIFTSDFYGFTKMSAEDQQYIGKYIPNWARPFASIITCAISSIVMTGASVAIKKIDNHFSGGILLILMARFVVMLLMCSPILCYK